MKGSEFNKTVIKSWHTDNKDLVFELLSGGRGQFITTDTDCLKSCALVSGGCCTPNVAVLLLTNLTLLVCFQLGFLYFSFIMPIRRRDSMNITTFRNSKINSLKSKESPLYFYAGKDEPFSLHPVRVFLSCFRLIMCVGLYI